MMSIVFLNSAYFISLKGLGESVIAGYFGAIATLTGFIAGFVFGKMVKKLGRFTVGTGPLILGIGMLILYFSDSVVTLIIGAIVCGLGFYIPQPGVVTELAIFVPKRWATLSSALQQALKALSNFLAGYFTTFIGMIIIGADAVTTLIAGAAVSIIVGVAFLVIRIFRKWPEGAVVD